MKGLSRRSQARSRWRPLLTSAVAMLCIAPALAACWATIGAAVLTTTLQIGANAFKLDSAFREWAQERELEKRLPASPGETRGQK